MPSKNSKWNKRDVDEANAIERAESRKRFIDAALASTAGQGQAGVEEGEKAKETLEKDGGGLSEG
ncbi:MAG: hypothetical protein WD473_11985 [Acidimicrobiia bacterium]